MRHQENGPAFSRPACLVLSAAVLIAAALVFLSLGEVRADIIHSSLGGGFAHGMVSHHLGALPFPTDGAYLRSANGTAAIIGPELMPPPAP